MAGAGTTLSHSLTPPPAPYPPPPPHTHTPRPIPPFHVFSRYLRCRGGNFTIGPHDIWGISLVQTQEFTVVTTISSSRRGLLSMLGSIGGAYSIVYVV